MWYLYLIGCIIAAFFSWRKWSNKMIQKSNQKRLDYWADQIEFYIIIAITFFYPITIPIMLFWKLLEFLTNLFINKRKKEK